jgi:hypothetical protein
MPEYPSGTVSVHFTDIEGSIKWQETNQAVCERGELPYGDANRRKSSL